MSVLQATTQQVTAKRAALLAIVLLVAGFCVGYGTGAGRRRADTTNSSSSTPVAALVAPLVKGMRLSSSGKLLAFTTIYDHSRRSACFVLDLTTHHYSAREAPRGWQDYVSGWTSDSKVLFEREKIPRPVDDATPGIYQEPIRATANGITRANPDLLSAESLAGGSKVIGGFLDPNDHLIVRARREPKGLFALQNGEPRLLLEADSQLYQNRAIRENGKIVYYVARDVPGQRGYAALYRLDGSGVRQLGPAWKSPAWIYLREDARQLIVCHGSEDDAGWEWALYDVSPQKLTPRETATIPQDVIAVYWSPDGKTVLGTGGDDVWAIDVATLHAHKLPRRPKNIAWSADDAAWLNGSTALVAADGELWQVDVSVHQPLSAAWKIPQEYWK